MTIELPENLDAALKAQARAQSVSEASFVWQMLEQVLLLSPPAADEQPGQPLETGYGMWSQYGPAPPAEEIDENRCDMFRHFGQEF